MDAGIVCFKKIHDKYVYISTTSPYVVKIILKVLSFLQQKLNKYFILVIGQVLHSNDFGWSL